MRAEPSRAAVDDEPPDLDFGAVYRAHADFVWQVLRRLGVRDADLEDVCQEVFATVHRKLGDFGARSAVKTWVYGIAFRAASEHRRRAYNRREQPSDRVDVEVDPSTPLEALARHEARAVLAAILDGMDEDKRAVFVFYEIEQLSMAEVAEVVGCPLQTAYSRLHAARRAFDAAIRRHRAKEGTT